MSEGKTLTKASYCSVARGRVVLAMPAEADESSADEKQCFQLVENVTRGKADSARLAAVPCS
jgi:hypothetical protein